MVNYILNKSSKITILFLSWRDIKTPKSGGAEVFTHEMLKGLDFNRYRIIHFSPMFEGAKEIEDIDNVKYLRCGNILSVIGFAREFYKKYAENIDFVVDQCNTHRFFTSFWVKKQKRIFFIHQLTREIWFKNSKFPVSLIGYLAESAFLRLNKKDYTITVSNSTKDDLLKVGFNAKKIFILPEGIEFEPWKKEQFLPKVEAPVFGYIGRFVSYKGIDAAVKAYSSIKKKYPNSKLWIIGRANREYMDKVLKPILKEKDLSYGIEGENVDVVFYGFVSQEEKLELMSQMKALVFPSQREGWGLTITEGAAVGTPSIVYNSKGLVDAVDFGRAGYLCKENTINSLVELMERVIEQEEEYNLIRKSAYKFSLNFKWENTTKAFDEFITHIKGGV